MNNLLPKRKNIFKKIKDLYKKGHKKEIFIPLKSKINYAGRVYNEKELVNLVDASLDFWLTAGRYTEEFEKKLAAFIGVKYASFVNSGSSANLVAITALTSPSLGQRRLKPCDEIITTALAFPTTVAPIIQNRMVPVFVDVDLGTYNINIIRLKKAISRKTKAIFLAHTLGNPFCVEEVKKICRENRLWLIEDNCDALGSEYKGKKTGSFGDIATCSFYPAHHITTGEGGAVLTNDFLLNKIINSFRDWGRDCWCKTGMDNTCGRRFSGKHGALPKGYDHKYVYSHLGYNLKATEMQAAIGVAQLDKLADFINKRRENHKYLYSNLKDLSDRIILPVATKYSSPSWFGFVITLKGNQIKTRNDIVFALEKTNIQTRLLFAGNIIKQPCFLQLKKGYDYKIKGTLKNTDKAMNDGFWVGVYPGITEEKIKYMLDKIKLALGKYLQT
ncbi:MAG: lipopolysaccharide biosynthesis protein RfbH [Candidatus Omnitrophica bacterium]|jgi:CDP-6-deoxy-D-xylo-4-hexulose-3-dehydrase|nr:lipopolysaccharide biosynthesis protein RfbH [Candidatus Omnitrophota bacterium]